MVASPLRPVGTHPTPRFEGRSNTRKRRRFQEIARAIPRVPGVYFFYGSRDRLLYVGKAKCLRERVRSYFAETSAPRPPKIRRLLAEMQRLEWKEVGSELEALLLERRLIAEEQPVLNRQHKRFKVYPYLVLTDEAFPRFTLTRAEPVPGEHDSETDAVLREMNAGNLSADRPFNSVPRAGEVPGVYLGPFTTPRHAAFTLEAVRNLFPLRACEAEIVPDVAGRGCFYREIKRCSGPCVGDISPQDYAEICRDLIQLLRTGDAPQMERLRQRMAQLAALWRFEEAGAIKEQLATIQLVANRLLRLARMRTQNNVAIVQAGHCPDGRPALALFLVRGGIVGRHLTLCSPQDWREVPLLLREVYGPPLNETGFTAKTELDEMMILDRWLRVHRDDPQCVWLNPTERESRQWAGTAARRLARAAPMGLGEPLGDRFDGGLPEPRNEAALSHHCEGVGNEPPTSAFYSV